MLLSPVITQLFLKKKKQINLEELQKLLNIYYNDFR